MKTRRIVLAILIIVLSISIFSSCKEKTTEPEVETVATPTFDPVGGTYTTAQEVSITCSTPDATIRYTTDSSEPTSTSTTYASPFNVSETTTIKAMAFKDGWTPSPTASSTFTISPCPEQMVYVPAGTFTMGDAREEGDFTELPTHSVSLNSFYMSKYEVTQAEYAEIMGSYPAHDHGVGEDYPVYHVSWYSAIKYCNLLSMAEELTPVYSISGSTNPANWGAVPTNRDVTWDAALSNFNANGYRLPTEAEWEYAARGATNDPDYLYSGSEDINDVAWYDDNSGGSTHIVGTKAPNALGLYDMSGNVYEWCWDWYSSDYYGSSPDNDPTGPESGSRRVRRGGYWNYSAFFSRVADRRHSNPYESSHDYLGLRLCRSGL